MLSPNGVGTDVAGQLLVTAGDNPDRLAHEAAFAALCGSHRSPPHPARPNRHRLNRGGDRQPTALCGTIVLSRMATTHPPGLRRTTNRRGLSNQEIMRCLKRYVAREIYNALTGPRPGGRTSAPHQELHDHLT